MTSSINRVRLAVSAVTASGVVFGVAGPALAAPSAVAAAPTVTPAADQSATVAAFTLSASSGTVPPVGTGSATVTIDASASVAGGGATRLWYTFYCGDGVTVGGAADTNPVASCTYTKPGQYSVYVTVTDDKGVTATAPAQTFTVTLGAPVSPTIANFAVGPYDGAGQTAWADLSQITFDPRADPSKVTFALDWGDGTKESYTAQTRNNVSGQLHRYAEPGTYTVSLTVNDGLGLSTSVVSTSKPVTVQHDTLVQAQVSRAAGSDRYDTGVRLSRKFWIAADKPAAAGPHATSVVLATGTAFPDALAGVPLANFVGGPLLLTDPHALTPEVETEIKRILPSGRTVHVLGGGNAINPAVAERLTALGYKVDRIAGADRYDTSVKIAHAMGDPALAVVARGDDFPDALAAGPFATSLRNGSPYGGPTTPSAVILSDNGALTPEAAGYLKSRLATAPTPEQAPTHLVAIGGGAAKAVGTLPGVDENPTTGNTLVFVGANRYDTAAKVAGFFLDSGKHNGTYFSVGIATGVGYADALTGGSYLSEVGGGPLLLTDPASESPETSAELTKWAGYAPNVLVLGGTTAVSAGVFSSVVSQVHGVVAAF